MRKLFTLFAFVAILGLSGTAFASGSIHHNACNGISNCDGDTITNNDNSTTNKGGAGGDGGTGYGGDASSSLGAFNDFGGAGGDATAFGGSGGDASSSLGAFNDFGGSGGSGGDVDDSGNSSVGNGFGNFSPDSNSSSSASQGQQQGQIGIVKDGDVAVDSNDVVNVDASDNSVHSIENDFPVNTAAPVFAGNCSQGISAQTMSFGGSIASGNPVCDYIAVAGAYIAGGDRHEAFRVLAKAENAADWRAVFAKIRMCLTIGLL